MRAVVEVEEDAKGRTILVVTELPYQVNPDNLIESIAALAPRRQARRHRRDQRRVVATAIGMRIVITLKRDAVAKVVLNNLYKHTQLQYGFGVNMLAIVDGVPRTLRLDQMVRHYIRHQIEVIVRRTRYRLRKAEERAHILRGYVKALDALDEVIALIRASETVDVARAGLMELLDVDEIQAQAILDMQLRRLAALERQKIIDELAEIERDDRRPRRTSSPGRSGSGRSSATSSTEIVEKHGDERRTQIVADDGDVTNEDLIAVEDVVVTITQTGYAKRTKTDLYRAQKRGGKGVQGAHAEAGRHRRALLRVLHARLDAVLHQQGPGVPAQGLRAARGQPQRPRPARGQPARVPARRAHRPGHADQGLPGGAVPGARDAGPAW